VILVVAHAGDTIARRLAGTWGARLLTPRDLSSRGWRHFPVGGGDDTLGVGGEAVPAAAIRGVLTRLGAVTATDLPHIAAEDRGYVAAEMTAFLLSFLRALPCPVLNRPTASSLMGPGWTSARWRAAAVAAGLDVAGDGSAGEIVTIVGSRSFGLPRLAGAAASLARHAGIELFSARFTAGGAFIEACPWSDLPDAAAAAVRETLA
jgi:hypothetical protein